VRDFGDDPLTLLGCIVWLLAPLGATAGALVLDERADVVRKAKLGIALNTVAFLGALCATYRAWRILDFD
jgi:hypothetical protein